MPALGEADAVLNCVSGVNLVGVDCCSNAIVLLPPMSCCRQSLWSIASPSPWMGDTCAAARPPGCHRLTRWSAAANHVCKWQ